MMNEVSESDDPMIYLIYHSISPETLVRVLPSIQEMKKGEVTVTSLPWKSTVQVSYESTMKRELGHLLTVVSMKAGIIV